METTTTATLADLGEPTTILLTTYRRNGAGVATPVSAVWDGDEAAAARKRLARRSPVLHGVVVPLTHRLKGWTTVHLELTDDRGAA